MAGEKELSFILDKTLTVYIELKNSNRDRISFPAKEIVSGKKEVVGVSLKEEVVDPDDIEMLEDLIVAATNEALRKMEEDSQEKMGKVTGGLGGMGGGFPF